MSAVEIRAKDVKALRDRTGIGMMDAKAALQEAGGDMEKAVEIARMQGAKDAGKLADREASEGVVASYVHATGKIGVLVEVNCNTDFVARNEDFQEFAREVALHVAALGPDYVHEDEISEEWRAKELALFEEQAGDKPENVRPKIAEGKMRKRLEEVVLLKQEHVNAEKHAGKTIEELRTDLSAKTGENIVIRRFARFNVGA
ncbi:MAG: translation elongation factor Ts [Thermoleophilaceae bacterium]|nr:translation elongation factor Ts [Thermoleophilaceae bacterium]